MENLKKLLANATYNEEEMSITIKSDKLQYCLYFDKNYHSVFMGESMNGILIEAQAPDDPNGKLSFVYWPKW